MWFHRKKYSYMIIFCILSSSYWFIRKYQTGTVEYYILDDDSYCITICCDYSQLLHFKKNFSFLICIKTRYCCSIFYLYEITLIPVTSYRQWPLLPTLIYLLVLFSWGSYTHVRAHLCVCVFLYIELNVYKFHMDYSTIWNMFCGWLVRQLRGFSTFKWNDNLCETWRVLKSTVFWNIMPCTLDMHPEILVSWIM
jgi:hypothetical protein